MYTITVYKVEFVTILSYLIHLYGYINISSSNFFNLNCYFI